MPADRQENRHGHRSFKQFPMQRLTPAERQVATMAAEGAAYLGGGFNASYLRRGGVVLIPIRVGAGIRLGANVGYMRFSKEQRWLPF